MVKLSYIFDYGEDTVWSPALRVGELYVVLASEIAKYLGVPVGLTANAVDHHYIELEDFRSFVDAMCQRYFSSRHVLQRSLLDGVLTISLGMLVRCGVALPVGREGTAELVAKVKEVLREMPD